MNKRIKYTETNSSPIQKEKLDEFWKAVDINPEEACIILIYEEIDNVNYRKEIKIFATNEERYKDKDSFGTNYGILDRYDLSG